LKEGAFLILPIEQNKQADDYISSGLLIYLVSREGLEPSTYGLKVRCSTN
jgi:hypothetical protein